MRSNGIEEEEDRKQTDGSSKNLIQTLVWILNPTLSNNNRMTCKLCIDPVPAPLLGLTVALGSTSIWEELRNAEVEHTALENKFSQMKERQQSYDSALTVVKKNWEQGSLCSGLISNHKLNGEISVLLSRNFVEAHSILQGSTSKDITNFLVQEPITVATITHVTPANNVSTTDLLVSKWQSSAAIVTMVTGEQSLDAASAETGTYYKEI
ncbi:hypothetical protein HN873_036333 [Arachis hypogaea]